jgi:hypothetical protein
LLGDYHRRFRRNTAILFKPPLLDVADFVSLPHDKTFYFDGFAGGAGFGLDTGGFGGT